MNLLIPENSYMGKCSCGADYLAPKGTLHCSNCLYTKIKELEKERDALIQAGCDLCFYANDTEEYRLAREKFPCRYD